MSPLEEIQASIDALGPVLRARVLVGAKRWGSVVQDARRRLGGCSSVSMYRKFSAYLDTAHGRPRVDFLRVEVGESVVVEDASEWS